MSAEQSVRGALEGLLLEVTGELVEEAMQKADRERMQMTTSLPRAPWKNYERRQRVTQAGNAWGRQRQTAEQVARVVRENASAWANEAREKRSAGAGVGDETTTR